jgi:hypothetical protein
LESAIDISAERAVLRGYINKDEVSVARDLAAPLLGAHAARRGQFWRGTLITFTLIQSNTAASSECRIGRFYRSAE